MNYHIARDGQQIGVFSEDDLRTQIKQGAVKPTDLAWCSGMSDWKPASEVLPDAFAPPSVAPEPTGAVPPEAKPVGPPPMASAPAGVPPTAAGDLPPKPENYLVWAILVTVLCCLPLGIVSIVFASQVDSKYQAGDYQGAIIASRKAKTFMWWSVGLWVVGVVITIAIQVVVLVSGGSF